MSFRRRPFFRSLLRSSLVGAAGGFARRFALGRYKSAPRRRYRRSFMRGRRRGIRITPRRRENKTHGFDIDEFMSTTFNATSCVDISQGSTGSTRDGDQLYLRSIYWTGEITKNASATDTHVRLVLFQWRPSRYQAPDQNALFSDTSHQYWSPYLTDNIAGGNLRILADRKITLKAEVPSRLFKIFVTRGFYRNLAYSAGTTTTDNKIYALWISNEATNTPIIASKVMVNFSDI